MQEMPQPAESFCEEDGRVGRKDPATMRLRPEQRQETTIYPNFRSQKPPFIQQLFTDSPP